MGSYTYKKSNSKKNKRQRGKITHRNRRTHQSEKSLYIGGVKNISECVDGQDNSECSYTDTQISNIHNSLWKTCISKNYHKYNIGTQKILYITPINTFIKSVETIQIPKFNISINGEIGSYPIKIDNKYINCFLRICGKWYAIMRLFGHVFFSEFLARNEKMKTFYRISDQITFNIENGLITISTPGNPALPSSQLHKDKESIDRVQIVEKKKILHVFKKVPTILLPKSYYENINKNNGELVDDKNIHLVYWILNTFRTQKMIATSLKQDLFLAAVD